MSNPTSEFLTHLWEPLPDGLIEIRTLVNSQSPQPRREWFEDVDSAVEYASGIGRDRNVFFGVAKRKRAGSTKSDLLGVAALWVDLDSVSLGWDTEACIKRIVSLPAVIRPSALVRSGGGVHAYFLLAKPLQCPAQTRFVESCNATLAKSFSGDNAVCDVSRILRLPGSWSAKRQTRCEVEFCQGHWRFDPVKLVKAVEEFGPVFVGDEFPDPVATTKGRTVTVPVSYAGFKPVSLNDIWSSRVKYHAPGGGTIGINEAIMITVCRLHNSNWRDARVIDETLRRVQSVHADQAPEEEWDWDVERENIRKSLDRWKVKWAEMRKTVSRK